MPIWAYLPKGKVMLMCTCGTVVTAKPLKLFADCGIFLLAAQHRQSSLCRNISALKTQTSALLSSSVTNRSWPTLYRLWALLGEGSKSRRRVMCYYNHELLYEFLSYLHPPSPELQGTQSRKRVSAPNHLRCAMFDTIDWLPHFFVHIKMLQLCHWTRFF